VHYSWECAKVPKVFPLGALFETLGTLSTLGTYTALRKVSQMEVIDWGYAISTLLIRFVGIFVVLGILQVVMQLTGRIFAHLNAKSVAQTKKRLPRAEELTQEEAAAIAVALYLDEKTD
jgi:Na+-transporting methylmalonyl-CoA/oxaloacetate decarboxylase gamma subunit